MAEYISINDLISILGDNIDGTEDFLVTKNNISYKITLNELDKFLRINEIDKLSKSENFNDLENKETARINLEVYSKDETEELIENNIIELGEKTSGDYVKSIQGGNGIIIEGNIGEGSENIISLQQIGTAGTYTKVQTNEYGQVINNELLNPNDIPNLDASKITSGIIDSSRLPSFVDDVIEVAKYINLPIPGETSKIYIVINDETKNNQTSTYRWTGSLYALVSNNLTALDIKNLYESNTNTNAFTDILLSKLNTIESGAQVNTVTKVSGRVGDITLTKNDVGLSNVKNIDTTNASNITTGTIPLNIIPNSSVLPGEYTKISVDVKGRVLSGSKPTNIQDYGITDVYTKTEINNALPNVGFDKTTNLIPGEGQLTWDIHNSTLALGLSNNVIQQIGCEIYFPKRTYNNTTEIIKNGTPVRFAGIDNVNDRNYIDIMIPDYLSNTYNYLGLATEDIQPNSFGRVTYFGRVNNIDTSNLEEFKNVYVGIDGTLTSIPPKSPDKTILVGYCVKSHLTEGIIFVRHNFIPESLDISYNNLSSELIASNVQSAIDELQEKKANIDMLSSNIVLYPTNANSDISGYLKMVTSTTDLDFNTTPFDFNILNWGSIPVNQERLLINLVTEPGLFIGNPGILNITTIGNIKKISGNNNENAEFYFKIYHRTASGVETLVGTSNTTGAIDPFNDGGYKLFSTYSIFNNGTFLDTDRVVIKYFGKKLEGHNPEYTIQFGGNTPTRTLLPVPVSVIPSDDASKIITDTSNFINILNAGDDNVQKALEKIDDNVYSKDDINLKLNSKISSYNISNIEYNTGIKRNNKDIYGLEVDLGNLPDTGIKEIPFTFNINYQYWVDTSNSYASDSDEVITLPYGGYIGDDISVKLDKSNNKIIIIASRDRTSLIGKLIILYTK